MMHTTHAPAPRVPGACVVPAGSVVSDDDVTSIRAADGLAPSGSVHGNCLRQHGDLVDSNVCKVARGHGR